MHTIVVLLKHFMFLVDCSDILKNYYWHKNILERHLS